MGDGVGESMQPWIPGQRAAHLDTENAADVLDVAPHELLDVGLAERGVLDLVDLPLRLADDPEVVAEAVPLDVRGRLCGTNDAGRVGTLYSGRGVVCTHRRRRP